MVLALAGDSTMISFDLADGMSSSSSQKNDEMFFLRKTASPVVQNANICFSKLQ
jgi:hypothetical protein